MKAVTFLRCLTFLGVVVISNVGCSSATEGSNQNNSKVLSTANSAAMSRGIDVKVQSVSLADGTYTFHVTATWDHKDRFCLNAHKNEPLPEALFTPVESGAKYTINITADNNNVQITNDAKKADNMMGTLKTRANELLFYHIDTGLFAGGRLLIWQTADSKLRAELAIYGSGVPLSESMHGSLIKDDVSLK